MKCETSNTEKNSFPSHLSRLTFEQQPYTALWYEHMNYFYSKSRIKKILWRFLWKGILLYFLLTVFCISALRWVAPKTSTFMIFQQFDAEQKQNRNFYLQYSWISYKKLPSYASIAVIAAEDQKFLQHHGFDFESIKEAGEDYFAGKRVRGASTISQQVAKNLFLWKGKNWLRKGLEVYYTFLLELILPKKRILEIYLNIAEFGDGIFGINRASKIFFKKAPQNLNRHECALLAAVLPNPKRFKVKNPSVFILKRKAWILSQMNRLGRTTILDDL